MPWMMMPSSLASARRPGSSSGVFEKQDTEIDAVAGVAGLNLQELILKPIEAGIVVFGADEPDADLAQVGLAGLGAAAALDRGGAVIVLPHHGLDARQAVRSDQLRLIDGPGTVAGETRACWAISESSMG
jgi:hypothetical protein